MKFTGRQTLLYLTTKALHEMIDLTPGMFVTPAISLIAIALLYIYFLKKASDKPLFRRFIGAVAGLSFLLNYAWEIGHCPLYTVCMYDGPHIIFLALASLADVIMVGLLYFGFALIYRNGLWIMHLTASRVFWLILVGGAGATVSEIAHLSTGNWAYTNRMPIIPGIEVGLTPVLQFTILPVLIYSLSSFLLLKSHETSH